MKVPRKHKMTKVNPNVSVFTIYIHGIYRTDK